jgi:putative SOS response-associated peptidase YedK
MTTRLQVHQYLAHCIWDAFCYTLLLSRFAAGLEEGREWEPRYNVPSTANVPGKEPLESFTIITTDAKELASEVHDRVPVILDADDYKAWLAGEEIPLVPFDSEWMTARPIISGRSAWRRESK